MGGREAHAGQRTVVVAVTAAALVLLLLASLLLFTTDEHDEAPSISTPATSASATSVPSTATSSTSTSTTPSTLPPTTLPPGPAGEYLLAGGGSGPVGLGPLRTYQVEVEAATGVDPVGFASVVDAALQEPRSWTADGGVSLQRVAQGGEIRVVLATPGTTDAICAPLQTAGRYSCAEGTTAMINLERWLGGAEGWSGDLHAYRLMVINHEVGHVLGHDHEACPSGGELAPVMQQQTKGLDGCLPNEWPFPWGPPGA